ncbi:hypothetical protein MtrunA17_Chr2g0333431 [Medicago truncatula]|uniref:Serine-rich protein n=1 Tax=Medicago truncatula TaxID=3880 RepID=G7IIB8_MEDTR|nr:putative uncharacterized protein DDB_G0288537 [Medicago truncatula]AES68205.1 hypothetical protein MTR_2g104380 [Medicago truncatula]RHN76557.1 hypothetical protein MtrunA17_Chr2g0333431 [Medicago truncatula]
MTMAFRSSRSETSSYSHFASSSVSTFSPRASPVMMQSSSYGHRSTPPSPPSPSSTVRFSTEQRPESPGPKSMTAVSSTNTKPARRCMCSPTTHAGSFRCAYHKRMAEQEQQRQQKQDKVHQQHQQQKEVQQKQHQQQQRQQITAMSRSRTLNLRRSAMKNSLIRIGVEGEILKRTLTNLIRPSPQQLRRREAFQAKPSRLSVMSKAA